MTLPKRALVLAVVLVTQGCMIDYKRGNGPQLISPPRTGAGSHQGLARGFGSKIVEGKQPPVRLVARDGTSCLVSRKKFESAEVGEAVWCTWTDTNR